LLRAVARVVVEPGTRLVEIPRIVLDEADRAGVKAEADFTLIYKLIRYRARSCVSERVVIKPILVLIGGDGSLSVYPVEEVKRVLTVFEEVAGEASRRGEG